MSFSAIKYLHYSPGFPLGPRGNDIFSDCSGNNPYIASGGLKFLIIILPPNHPQFMSHQNVAQKIFYGFKMIKRSGNFRDSVYSFQNIGGLMVCYYTSLKYFQSLERGILIISTVSGETILGASLNIGYFAQAHEGLHLDWTLMKEIDFLISFL